MSRMSFAGSLVVAVLFGQSSIHAQDGPEPVNITTVDGVKLKGMFYPSSQKSAPTVIMLHPIGEGKGMKAPEWKSLALALQKANYSVMMFDFRGHGDSTTIDNEQAFWTNKMNFVNVKVKDPKDKTTIDVKDYIKQGNVYLPVLVNDIAAVRAYLDRRNDDSKDCNTSSIIIVGADTGATLGAIWINAEWHRYKFTPNPMFPFNIKLGTFATQPEGSDIIGAVFLTISPSLEKRKVKLESLLRIPCKDKGMAAAFFVGAEDKETALFTKGLVNKLKVKDNPKHAFIAPVEMPKTTLTGIKLLNKQLPTEKAIVDSLELYVPDEKRERVQKDFPNTNFMWRMPVAIVPARSKKGESNLVFDDYSKFIPQ